MAQDNTILADEVIADEADSFSRHRRLVTLIWWQAVAIAALMAILVVGAPVMRPSYSFFARRPDDKTKQLVPLNEPNLTNQAVLSWTATSITEIMTLGFGDFDRQLLSQRMRFTDEGWESFLMALYKQGIRDAFKKQQLVLTTVPSDSPVIVAQGEDIDGKYFWQVELPIIMTYMTNNNMTQKSRAIIQLTIVRVPSSVNIGGIAIKAWKLP